MLNMLNVPYHHSTENNNKTIKIKPLAMKYKLSDLSQSIATKLLPQNYFSIFLKACFSAF